MFSLSTSWNCTKHKNGSKLCNEIKNLGFKSLELGFSLSKKFLSEVIQTALDNSLKISSVHNFCPIPNGYSTQDFLPDTFSLASPDDHQRKKAVDLTLHSMDTVKEANAKALIIHAGRVEMPDRTKELIKLYNQNKQGTPCYEKLIENIKTERKQKKAPYIAAIKKSITELLKRASSLDIKLCIENRYYWREIPQLSEIGELIDEFFNSKNFGYWHDVGHAQVNENLGLGKHLDFLEKYHQYIVGVHLHDIDGSKDHLAPGAGVFDFSSLKPYLKNNTIRVLEIHQPATTEQVKAAVPYLHNLGIDYNE